MSWCSRTAAAVVLVVVTTSCGAGGAAVRPLQAAAPDRAPDTSSPSASRGATPGPSGPATGLVLTIYDPRVRESSGLARSPKHPGVLYTHNDRGDTSDLFAVNAIGTPAVLTLRGTTAVDWEDMASTPDGRLWVGDIGDAEETRRSVSVSVVEEPSVLTSTTLPTTTYRFRYPDGRHNAETLLVHPETQRVYIVTKEPEGGAVYAAPQELAAGRTHPLRRMASAPPNVNAGGFSPDGTTLALRSYTYAYFYTELGGPPMRVATPVQRQGESIAFDATGTNVLLGSEGANSKILRMPVPRPFFD
jgi:hypothetical protein